MANQFGKYTLLQKLGDGGMAEVFLAQIQGPEGFTKLVALKRILPHLSQDETFTKSFINEARLGGYLNHHNIVQTLEFGQQDSFYYLAMEYVRGVTLADVLGAQKAQGLPMPPDMALQIALQIAEGLGYAHTAEDSDGRPLKMVHRDMKPSNILINSYGVCKIADFGVARAESNVQKTVLAGEVKGTVFYMSPEQALGSRGLNHRSDLYSLGSILFELLTNERLYPQESYLACLRTVQDGQIGDQLPKVLGLEQGIRLYQVLSKVLSYEPDDRHPTALELARDIREVLSQFNLDWELSDYLKRLLPSSPLVVKGTTNNLRVSATPSQPVQLHQARATTPPPNTPSLHPPAVRPATKPPPPKPTQSSPGSEISQTMARSEVGPPRSAWWRRPEIWIVAAVLLIVVGALSYRIVMGGGTNVLVRSVPPGALLSNIDGQRLGQAPTRIRAPKNGMTLIAALEGYKSKPTKLTGSKSQRDVLVRLDRIVASAEIMVSPEEAEVRLDDKLLDGKPPYSVTELPLGTHKVTVAADGFVTQEEKIDVTTSEPQSLKIELVPAEEAEGIETTSGGKPPAAHVPKTVPVANHSSHQSASSQTSPAVPKPPPDEPKKTQPAQTTVTKPPPPPVKNVAADPGFLTLNAFPFAYVELDGVRIKTTPLIKHPVQPGKHSVTLKTEDGREQTFDVSIESGKTFKKIVRFDAAH